MFGRSRELYSKRVFALIVATFFLANFLFVSITYAKLTQQQVEAIISLLESFNVDQQVIETVRAILEGKNQNNNNSGNSHGSNNTTNCPNLYRSLYIGKKGDDVKQLQIFLKQLGYFDYPEFTQYFGVVTRAAVRKFQCEHMNICSGDENSTGYGVVGPKTRQAIYSYCQQQNENGTSNVNTSTTNYNYSHDESSTQDSNSCTVGNLTIKHGESVKLYSTPQSNNCESYAQFRVCDNGELTGDDQYQYVSCSAGTTGSAGGSTPGGSSSGGGGGSGIVGVVSGNIYKWKVTDWSLCQNGTQTRSSLCIDARTGQHVDDRFCVAESKPALERSCYPDKNTVYTMLNEIYSMIFDKPLDSDDATVTLVFNQIKNNATLFDKYGPHFDSTTHFILRRFYNWLFFDSKSKTLHGILVGPGEVSNQTFVDKVYNIILDRQPTVQEKNEALSLLQKGYSRLEIARRVLMSDESRKKHEKLFESQYLRDPLSIEGVGQFIGTSMAQKVEPFPSDTRLVGAYIYRWYDYESKAHVCISASRVAPERKSWVKEWLTLDDGQRCAVVLTHRPPSYTNPLFSNKSKEYWKKQFRDMHAAGVDIAIFAGDFSLPNVYSYYNRMNYFHPINQALEELYNEGIKIKISLLLETPSLQHSVAGNPTFENIDLRYTDVQEFIYKRIRNFFSNINPKYWAVIDGKVPVYTWRPFNFIKNARDDSKKYIDNRFKEDFGIASNILFGDAINVINNHTYRYEWSGIDKRYRYAWGAQTSPDAAWVRNNIAQVSPGFDNSLSAEKLINPNKKPLIIPREKGKFYKKGWDTVYANPQVNLVLIETWDELHEGRGISETREFGRKYIDATRSYVNKWRSMNIEKQAVYAAYKSILKRYPDPGGLQTYETALKSGRMSLIEMMWVLFNSPEFANKFIGGGKKLSDLNDQEYVTLVYKTLLLRNPDPGGLNNYVSKLGSGERTRYEVFDIILNSGEFADKHPFYPYLKAHYFDLVR